MLLTWTNKLKRALRALFFDVFSFDALVRAVILFVCVVNANVHAKEVMLNPQAAKVVLSNTINIVEEHYLNLQPGINLLKALETKVQYGLRAEQISNYQLAKELDELLREESGDNYFSVTVKEPIALKHSSLSSKDSSSPTEASKMLTTDIGYLRIEKFSSSLAAEQELSLSMAKLEFAKALIIDLRHTEGESLSYAQKLMSYFMPAEISLSKVATQSGEQNMSAISNDLNFSASSPFPLYILLSGFSNTTAEFVGYTLQQFDKAVVLGDNTIGSARFVKSLDIGHGLQLALPVAQTIHPSTGDNWQNGGVSPDIGCKKDECLVLAEQHATSFLK
ncbi:MAG: hypothetical protein CL811_05065 [Colwelliaceae bacterium]|nr:hypothetical protein [Colwelliaceae bacterium]